MVAQGQFRRPEGDIFSEGCGKGCNFNIIIIRQAYVSLMLLFLVDIWLAIMLAVVLAVVLALAIVLQMCDLTNEIYTKI